MRGSRHVFLAFALVSALGFAAPAEAASAPPKPGIIDANPHQGVVPAGQKFAFKVVARNVDHRASGTQSLVFLLNNSKSVKGARKVGTGTIPSIPKHTDRAVFGFSVTIPLSVKPGGYRLMICLPRRGKSPHCSKTISLSVRKPIPPKLQLTPTSADFGEVLTSSTSSARTFTLKNVGGSPTSTITTGLGGTDVAQFAKTSDGCNGHQLSAADTCTVEVSFGPTSGGAKTASLTANASAGGTASATLSGTGQIAAHLTISPTSADFGNLATGASGTAQTFTVTNTGGVSSGSLSADVSGTNHDQFAVSDDGCSGASLAAGHSCTVSGNFTPDAVGSASASLDVTGAPGGTASASLTGTGSTPAHVTLSPVTLDFGSVVASAHSNPKLITITNTGGVPSGNLLPTVTGPDHGSFVVGGAGQTCVLGAPLAAGASCKEAVQLYAGDSGHSYDATFTITASPGTPSAGVSVDLTGKSVDTAANLVVTLPGSSDTSVVSSFDLNAPGGGEGATAPVQVTNTGAADSGPISFAEVVDSFTIPAPAPGQVLSSNGVGPAPDAFGTGCALDGSQILKSGESCYLSIGIRTDPTSDAGGGAVTAWHVTLTASGSPGGSPTFAWINP